MDAKAKICGLSTPEGVRAALDGGAAFVGFVFFPKSPRHVTAETAFRLAEPARGRARVAAVVVDPSDAELDVIVQGLRPDLLQLHGRETPRRAAQRPSPRRVSRSDTSMWSGPRSASSCSTR